MEGENDLLARDLFPVAASGLLWHPGRNAKGMLLTAQLSRHPNRYWVIPSDISSPSNQTTVAGKHGNTMSWYGSRTHAS